jgi:hypothetical protein
MATGRAAFGAHTAALMREAILNAEPTAPRDLNPTVPEELARIIAKALQKDREKRYQNAVEIRADLEQLRHEAQPRRPFRFRAMMAGGLALLIVAAVFNWVRWRQPNALTSTDVKLKQLTNNSWENPVTSGVLSPDGRYLAYVDLKGMHVKLVGTDDSQPVPEPDALRDKKVVW